DRPYGLEHVVGRRRLGTGHRPKHLRNLWSNAALGLVRAERRDHRRGFDQRVVGDSRDRRVAATAAYAQPKRRAQLLGDRTEPIRVAVELDTIARPLVDAK